MTKISKKTKAVALAAFLGLITIGTVSTAQNSRIVPSEHEMGTCYVTEGQIIDYLQGFGYSGISVGEGPGCDRVCTTTNAYNTKVFCTETQIIGHEDLQ